MTLVGRQRRNAAAIYERSCATAIREVLRASRFRIAAF
jgi:hypothetical protein